MANNSDLLYHWRTKVGKLNTELMFEGRSLEEMERAPMSRVVMPSTLFKKIMRDQEIYVQELRKKLDHAKIMVGVFERLT